MNNTAETTQYTTNIDKIDSGLDRLLIIATMTKPKTMLGATSKM